MRHVINNHVKNRLIAYLDNIEPRVTRTDSHPKGKTVSDILYMNYSDGKGGAAALCSTLFKTFNAQGMKTSMLVGRWTSHEDHISEISRNEDEIDTQLVSFQNSEGWFDFYHPSSFKIKNAPEFKTADILHIHNLHNGYFSPLALPILSSLKPVVWTLHDMQSFTGYCVHSYTCEGWKDGCKRCSFPDYALGLQRENGDFMWNLKRIIYEHADFCVVCPSQWLKSKVENSLLKEKRIELIYNGVDENVFLNIDTKRARAELGLPVDKKIILFVASFGMHQKAKGSLVIPEILERLSDPDLEFVSIGNPGLDHSDPTRLPYIDEQKKLALYYAAADILLFPSIAENCPLVVLESMSCGTPVVAYSVGGVPELIEHKKTGYLADYLDLNDLIRGIRFFLDDPNILKSAGEASREIVLRKFTLSRMVESYLRIYQTEFERFSGKEHQLSVDYKTEVTRLINEYMT